MNHRPLSAPALTVVDRSQQATHAAPTANGRQDYDRRCHRGWQNRA